MAEGAAVIEAAGACTGRLSELVRGGLEAAVVGELEPREVIVGVIDFTEVPKC
jgi:hypothetical protein